MSAIKRGKNQTTFEKARRIGFIYGLYFREDRDLAVLDLKAKQVNAFDVGFREGLSLR